MICGRGYDEDREMLGDIFFHTDSVFEWDRGESTLIATEVGAPRYIGLDNDTKQVAHAQKQIEMKHFRVYFTDMFPTEESLQKNLDNYQFAAFAAKEDPFDVYYMDGRYRVACVSVSFLYDIQCGGNMDKVRVGIHDNNNELFQGYDVIDI